MIFSAPHIPTICNYVNLKWSDVLWGYDRNIVNWSFVTKVADFNVSAGSTDPLELDLVCLTESDISEIEEKIRILAGSENESLDLSPPRKWVYIALKWLFENHKHDDDSLEKVEAIYEDFDFPSEIENFVRYMPPQDGYDPREHTSQENIERLFNSWRDYLDGMKEILS